MATKEDLTTKLIDKTWTCKCSFCGSEELWNDKTWNEARDIFDILICRSCNPIKKTYCCFLCIMEHDLEYGWKCDECLDK